MSGYRDRLEEEINRIGVTHISNVLGVVRNTIYNWMAKGNVPLNYLVSLQGLVEMGVHYVLTGARAVINLSPDEQTLIDGYRALDAATQRRMRAFVMGDEQSAAPIQKRVKVIATGGNAAGRDVKISKRVTKKP